jgi:hypothetical protein
MSDPYSQHDFRDAVYAPNSPESKSKGSWKWLWGLLIGGGLLVLLPCGGCVGFLVYMTSVGPETSVYTANELPKRFEETAREVGALEDGERILYFYSDALTDIRSGFYFVSDRKVVAYNQDAVTPLTIVAFDQIEDLQLQRDTSFLTDSEVHLTLKDGSPVSFPLSSELDRDQAFFEAIQRSIDAAKP